MRRKESGAEDLANVQARRRPDSVTALAALEIITGLVFLLGGSALLTFASGGSAALIIFGSVHLPIGVSFLILGGASLLSAKKLVWTLGFATVWISVVDDIVAFAFVPLPYDAMIGTAVVLVTALMAAYLLVRSEARSFFAS
jgi:hypothetical protein